MTSVVSDPFPKDNFITYSGIGDVLSFKVERNHAEYNCVEIFFLGNTLDGACNAWGQFLQLISYFNV